MELIKESLPVPRGGEKLEPLNVLNAFLYRLENGCKWRRLPKHFGNGNTLYMRVSRWRQRGVMERLFTRQQQERILEVKVRLVALDGTVVKVHPDGTGSPKKRVAVARQIKGRRDLQGASDCRE
jgi:transposase